MGDTGPVTVDVLTGDRLTLALPGLARLRLQVFRDWPYLYEGSLDYERTYLDRFGRAPGAVIVGAFAAGELVGAATAAPLAHEHAAFVAPFRARGAPVDRMFYLAESVLFPAFRGQGLGHRFFDEREAAARAQGFTQACFCAVIRPDDHPRRPPAYRPLDPFWRKRGYAPLPGMVVRFPWRDLDEPAETLKPMQVWARHL